MSFSFRYEIKILEFAFDQVYLYTSTVRKELEEIKLKMNENIDLKKSPTSKTKENTNIHF